MPVPSSTTRPRRLVLRAAAAVLLAASAPVALLGASESSAWATLPSACGGVSTNSSVNAWHSSSITTGSDIDWFRFPLTSSRQILLTLGGLSGNLSLDLYNSSCHLVVSSKHGGTHYEEIYRTLAASTYYARVTSVSGATSHYDVRFRVLPSGVTILSSHHTLANNRLTIVGEVLNNESAALDSAELDAIFYDRVGRVVTTTSALTDARYVPGWHRAPFAFEVEVPPTYDHYKLFLGSPIDASISPKGTTDFTITPGTPQQYSPGVVYPGTVKNDNNFAAHLLVVAAVVRDSHGWVVAESADYQDTTLAAGASRAYGLSFDAVSPGAVISYYPSASG
jgi:hypothetical protein